MALQITKVNCPSGKMSIKCPYSMTPTGITIHNTANDASAMSEISYMLSNSNQVSYHFAVDDTRAVQGIDLNRNAWHAGDGASGNGNRKTIAIEICYSKSGGDKYNKAVQNAYILVAMLMKQYGFKTTQIYYHQSWSGKYCPHRLLDYGVTLAKYRTNVQNKYNDLYVTNPSSSSKKYLNLFPTVEGRSVYNAKLVKLGTIKPKKYAGLSYLILGYTNSNRYVRIKTTTYGEVRICVDKNAVGDQFSITNSPKYK